MSKVFNFGQGRRAGEIFGPKKNVLLRNVLLIVNQYLSIR